MLVVQAGVPRSSIHVRNCRRRNDDFLSWDYPISDVDVCAICHSDDVEVHSEAQSLSVDGLKHRHGKQTVNIEPDAAVWTFDGTAVNLGSHNRK